MGEEQKTETSGQTAQPKPNIEELMHALEDEKRRSDEHLTRLKYAQADLENLQKRANRQVEDARKYSNERILLALLDVVDELEMAVDCGKTSETSDALVQGVGMTLKKLKKVLENEGIYPIECVGRPFDPTKHHAVAKVEKEDVPESTVVEEIRKGYTLREKVIRPSIVKVSVKPQSKSQKENELDE
jgi:molecular chaperone GrpE